MHGEYNLLRDLKYMRGIYQLKQKKVILHQKSEFYTLIYVFMVIFLHI